MKRKKNVEKKEKNNELEKHLFSIYFVVLRDFDGICRRE